MSLTDPTFRTRAEYDAWSRQHMVELNQLAVTNPAQWEAHALRIEALLAAIDRREREAA